MVGVGVLFKDEDCVGVFEVVEGYVVFVDFDVVV